MKIKFLGTTSRAKMAHTRLSVDSLTPPRTRFMLPAKVLSVKIRKTKLCPKFFHRIYGYKVVVTDYHFNNQKVSINGF